ncbi:hypothetical protein H4R34_000687 [Dimargaris verticillata]|uniref:Sugar phosphate transporter domain-containing protein n=1 Tax=Dimargaris verticillata TaxID=2761393 RepID=A0A9W8BBA4_9FUNG|nr:hypothetical protein H4R34_000687 [Dimargaris verticillata]
MPLPKSTVFQIAVSIGGWYLFSSLLGILNKRLFGKSGYSFDYPLFVTTCHAALQWLVSAILVHWFGTYWMSSTLLEQFRQSQRRLSVTGDPANRSVGALSWKQWFQTIFPCGFGSGLEIAMGNGALVLITLSFYTMVKSSTPIWVLLFAFIFRLETLRWTLILQIFLICFGVFLTVVGETQFHLIGFLLVLGAAVVSGFRWSLTQILLQHKGLGLNHPILTMYRLAPVIFGSMLLLTLIVENPLMRASTSASTLPEFATHRHAMEVFGLVFLGGVLALLTIIFEYRLIQLTSTVTLSVFGIAKEILVIALSILIFGDEMTTTNVLGVVISIVGILYYNIEKWSTRSSHTKVVELPFTSPDTTPLPLSEVSFQRVPTSE